MTEKTKKILGAVLFSLVIIGISLAMIFLKDISNCCYIIMTLCGLILFGVILTPLIEFSIKSNKEVYSFGFKEKLIFSLAINLLFSIFPTVFIVRLSENFNKPFTLISSPIALIILLIVIYFRTNIEEGDDISLLKATNYFVVFLFTAIKLLNIEKLFLIEYYFLLPIIIVQGFYELFDRKSRK